MNKERLEEIKNRRKKHDMDILPVWAEDIDWLIKQAERAEELDKLNEQIIETADKIDERNQRYREAINNIIEKVMLFGANEEVYEAIQDAIKALEGEE